MKVTFLSMLLLCSIAAFSQRIKISKTDITDHICRIGTTSRTFNKDAADGFALALRSENSSIFLQLYSIHSPRTIVADGNELVFELDNDSSVVVHSKGLQVSSAEFKAPIEYLVSLDDLKMLYLHTVKSISYYTAGGQYKSIKVKHSNEKGLQNVCNIFFKEYFKFSTEASTVSM